MLHVKLFHSKNDRTQNNVALKSAVVVTFKAIFLRNLRKSVISCFRLAIDKSYLLILRLGGNVNN